MVKEYIYDILKDFYGKYSSWAIWDTNYSTPKENVGNLDVFKDDADHIDAFLNKLNTEYVFLAYNAAKHDSYDVNEHAWSNFHSKDSKGNDYKLREFITGTKYEGAYMTDVYKGLVYTNMDDAKNKLKENPNLEKASFIKLNFELDLLTENNGGVKPTLIVFGGDAEKALKRAVEGYEIIKISHFANYGTEKLYQSWEETLL